MYSVNTSTSDCRGERARWDAVHAHDHRERLQADRRALAAALAIIACFTVVEVAAGLIAGSLALLADAGHMFTDAAALGAALFAAWMAARPARGPWTFWFRRVEILAAQANGILLALLGAWIVYAAIRRLVSPSDVEGEIGLGVGLAGIAVSLAATAILAKGSRESLNVRGAFLHVAADVVAFAGTSVAGFLILVTGWDRWDPLAGLAVAALIFWAAFRLLRDSARIFLEGAPSDIDPAAVGRALAAEPHVVEVHDLHVWTVSTGFPALSAHVLVEPAADCHAVRRSLELLLVERFELTHTTLQVEHASDAAGRVACGARRLERVAGDVTLALNVADAASCERFVAEAVERLGSLDILVNGAGLALGRDPFTASTEDDEHAVLETNVNGLLRMTRLCLPHLRDGGHIVNLGSVAGRQAYENGAVYVTSKFAVRGFTYALREDLLGRPIRITTVDPGLVETEFSLVRFRGDAETAANVYRGVEAMRPDDIAECVLFALTRPPHVNIDEIVVKALAQSSGARILRDS